MSKWSWLALGAGAYIAFALALFPAATAYSWFAPAEVQMVGVAGTVWSGGAELASVGGVAFREMRWRVRAWPLVVGRLSGTFEARLADGFVNGALAATPRYVEFTDLRASLGLPELQRVLPLRGVEGVASVVLERLRLEGGWPTQVVGSLRLGQLRAEPFIPTGQPGLIPLGDYEVTFGETQGEGLAATFRDTGGPLEVTGTLRVDRARQYTLDALTQARPGAPEPLLQGLEVMAAEPDAAGRRRLTLTGSL